MERDAPAAPVLVGQMAAGRLAPAPVWDDLAAFDARPWRGAVDCVLAGYPCQPFSVAGKRRGAADPRHLWPHVARVVGECRPAHVFLENVSAHLRLGGFDVLRELRAMGYRVAAGLFTAEEVGGSHRRERLFIRAELADAAEFRREDLRAKRGGESAGDDKGRLPQPSRTRGALDDAGEPRRRADEPRRGPPEPRRTGERQGAGLAPAPGAAVEHAEGVRREGRAAEGAGPRWAPGADDPLFPPRPGDLAAWDAILAERPDLAPALAEPCIRGVADGMASRVDRLRLLGNGVVPLVAAYAWRTLGAALRERRMMEGAA